MREDHDFDIILKASYFIVKPINISLVGLVVCRDIPVFDIEEVIEAEANGLFTLWRDL